MPLSSLYTTARWVVVFISEQGRVGVGGVVIPSLVWLLDREPKRNHCHHREVIAAIAKPSPTTDVAEFVVPKRVWMLLYCANSV